MVAPLVTFTSPGDSISGVVVEVNDNELTIETEPGNPESRVRLAIRKPVQ